MKTAKLSKTSQGDIIKGGYGRIGPGRPPIEVPLDVALAYRELDDQGKPTGKIVDGYQVIDIPADSLHLFQKQTKKKKEESIEPRKTEKKEGDQ